MNIVITGSLGHTSKPLTEEPVAKGHSVTVISSKPERQKDIEALGVKATPGTMEDADFLLAPFKGAVGFYNNLLGFINTIKTQGVIASNYGKEDKKPWVSSIDIAATVAEEITTHLAGRKVRYLASEEITCNEIASILGAAIGKPGLKWIVIPDEQLLKGMIAAGMNAHIAAWHMASVKPSRLRFE